MNTLSFAGGGSVPPPPVDDVDFLIFITYGQSNTDGRAPYSDAPEYVQSDGTVPNVKMWNGSSFQNMQLGINSGAEVPALQLWAFDLPLYYKIANQIGKQVLVIKRSKGGTSLGIGATAAGCWNIDFASIPEGTPKMLQEFEDRYAAATNYLNSINKTYRVVAAIRHQGEADKGSPHNAAFEQNLLDETAYVRSFVGNSELPIFIGNIPDLSSSYDAAIEAAFQNVCALPNNHLFDCSDTALLSDSLHFSATGNIDVANSIFTQMINLNLI